MVDYASMLYNPYFMNAYNSPYMDYTQFQKMLETYNSQLNTTKTDNATTTSNVTTTTNAPEVRQETKKDDDWTTEAIVGSVLTIGAAALCKKGYNLGTGKNVFQKTWNGISGLAKSYWNKVGSKFGRTQDNGIRAILGQDGKTWQFVIPGRTRTLKGLQIDQYAKNNNINITNLPSFNAKNTTINSFTTKLGGTKNPVTLTVKDGKITGLNYKNELYTNERDILNLLEEKPSLKKLVEGKIQKIASGDKKSIEKLTNVTYSFKRGTDEFTIVQNSLIETPTLTQMKTLHRYGRNSKAVKEYFKSHPNAQKAFSQVRNRKLPDNIERQAFTYESGGVKYYIENGKIVDIEANGTNVNKIDLTKILDEALESKNITSGTIIAL